MPISNKQWTIMQFPFLGYDAIIADGAIRSGKTSWMILSFVEDGMRRYNNQRFGICGKTVGSAEKNIIIPFLGIVHAQKKFHMHWSRTTKELIVERGNVRNTFEVFGGKDESSQQLIQGRTLAGILFDEVALMPMSFVQQAMGRCSVDGSLYWFNCNPESPEHWFYKEWVCQPEKHNALRLQFSLDDNPGLSEKKKEQYRTQYSGVFFQRFILGQWVVADGLVYDFGEANITDEKPKGAEYFVSVDYGTLNPFAAILWSVTGCKATAIKEYYYSGRDEKKMKTDEEYCDDMVEFVKGYHVRMLVVDPSAASFIASIRKRGFAVKKANNSVIDGIRFVSSALKNKQIMINRECTDTIREFGLYSWDSKKTVDAVIKENDHCLHGDTMVNTLFGKRKIRDLVGKFGLVWSYSEKTHKKVLRPFFNVRKTRENVKTITIETEDGQKIRCTSEHMILTEKGWKKAKYLCASDLIIKI